jgi:ABC-type Zn uptake system ZnuABC Zn-binding protein ZnuA
LKRVRWMSWLLGTAVVLLLSACGQGAPPAAGNSTLAAGVGGEPVSIVGSANIEDLSPANLAGGRKLRVVATTGILGDVVHNVAGDLVALTTLIGPNQDPHTYEPTPKDVAVIERADVVFINGLGLEEGLASTIDAAVGKGTPVVSASAGIQPRQLDQSTPSRNNTSVATPAAGRGHAAGDPHVWMDPENVKVWTDNLERSLSALDPGNAAAYGLNAAAYSRKLDELDAYIRGQVALIPSDRRKLVTDHEALGYFADRYGFQIVGAVIPSVSTSAEPSAGELAALIDKIRTEKVPAVFIGTTANPKLADLVARDTGATVLPLYTGEMGPPGSGADSYIGMMRADIDTIVKGLTQGS